MTFSRDLYSELLSDLRHKGFLFTETASGRLEFTRIGSETFIVPVVVVISDVAFADALDRWSTPDYAQLNAPDAVTGGFYELSLRLVMTLHRDSVGAGSTVTLHEGDFIVTDPVPIDTDSVPNGVWRTAKGRRALTPPKA